MEQNKVKDKTKLKKILAFTLIPLAIVISFVGGYFSRYIFHSKTVNTMTDLLTLIEQVGYVYDEQTGQRREITEEEIGNALVYGVLDQYSAYYTPEQYAQVNELAKGNLNGIGVSFFDRDNIIDVVVLNSPAELAGIRAGDKITGISGADGQMIEVTSLSEFSQAIEQIQMGEQFILRTERAGKVSTATLSKKTFVASYVKYMDSQKTMNFREQNGSLTPELIEGGMVSLDDATAYISLSEFNGSAGWQMEQALATMKERGRTKLILDLRDNGGGYTSILSEIASYLIYNNGASKSLIAFADGKKYDQSFFTNSNKFNTNITSISVIANDNTASASECLIGAMLYYKDYFDKSKLVIERNSLGVAKTYGKGIMQTTYGLLNGGALKLTTAKIFLPDKITSIHGVGFIAQGENAVEKDNAIAQAIKVLG